MPNGIIIYAVEDRIAGGGGDWETHGVFLRRSDAEIRAAVLAREEIPGWPGGRREARVVAGAFTPEVVA